MTVDVNLESYFNNEINLKVKEDFQKSTSQSLWDFNIFHLILSFNTVDALNEVMKIK